MRTYLELLDRIREGALLTEEEWDLDSVAMTTRALVDRYKLTWDPE